MKNNIILKTFLLLTCMLVLLALAGCGQKKSGNTIPEPEITTDYLTEEYSQQLMTDGAETMLGTVEVEKSEESEGTYIVHITEKEVVPSENYDEGYYIADTNVTKDVSLGFDARLMVENNGELELSDADSFIDQYPEGSEEQLFTVYLMSDSAELLMPAEPESIVEEQAGANQ